MYRHVWDFYKINCYTHFLKIKKLIKKKFIEKNYTKMIIYLLNCVKNNK